MNTPQLHKGDQAPAFIAKDQDNNEISLSQFKGKKVVLYFYPKDDTPGCTAQACNLRDNYNALISKISCSCRQYLNRLQNIMRHYWHHDI